MRNTLIPLIEISIYTIDLGDLVEVEANYIKKRTST